MLNLKKTVVWTALAASFAATTVFAAANPVDWTSAPEIDGQIVMKVGHSVNMEWSSHTATLKRFSELVSIYSNNEIVHIVWI